MRSGHLLYQDHGDSLALLDHLLSLVLWRVGHQDREFPGLSALDALLAPCLHLLELKQKLLELHRHGLLHVVSDLDFLRVALQLGLKVGALLQDLEAHLRIADALAHRVGQRLNAVAGTLLLGLADRSEDAVDLLVHLLQVTPALGYATLNLFDSVKELGIKAPSASVFLSGAGALNEVVVKVRLRLYREAAYVDASSANSSK